MHDLKLVTEKFKDLDNRAIFKIFKDNLLDIFSYIPKELSNCHAYDESEVVHDRQVDDDQPLIITKVTSPEMEVTEIILMKVSRLCQLSGNSRGFLSRL